MIKPLERILKQIYYFGFKYTCPFCNSLCRTFLPFGLKFPVLKQKEVVGGGYRSNALCPVCGSVDRERLLYLYLLHKTNIFKEPSKLLHVAPEPKLADVFLSKTNVDYLMADLNPGENMMKMDVTDIQFPDHSFDVVICNHVLEHVIDAQKAMSELYRVLKPGGWSVLQVPISLSLKNTYEDFSITTVTGREEAFGQADHVRIYAKDYKDRLEEVGFKVGIFQWTAETASFNGSKNKFGLNEKEDVYIARKLR